MQYALNVMTLFYQGDADIFQDSYFWKVFLIKTKTSENLMNDKFLYRTTHWNQLSSQF